MMTGRRLTSQVLLVMIGLFVCSAVGAQIPQQLSYQGMLRDASGNTLADGTHHLSIRLYGSVDALHPLYEEVQNVETSGGLFNIMIGSVRPFPKGLDFHQQYYLGLRVDDSEEMLPRTALSSVPYALNAAHADSASALSNDVQVVRSINGKSGTLEVRGANGITVRQDGSVLTIEPQEPSSTSINNSKSNKAQSTVNFGGDLSGSIDNTSSTWNVNVGSGKIITDRLGASAVTTSKINDGAVTAPKIDQMGASSGQVLKWNGSAWSPSAPLASFSESVNTSFPNNTVPVSQLQASSIFYSNMDVTIAPKGNGALMIDLPDNMSNGGNKRGVNAVDLQRLRSSASQVASGAQSIIMGGSSNTASGSASSVMGGNNNTAAGASASVIGGQNLNLSNTATGSFGYNSGSQMNITSQKTGVMANVDLWLANNDNSPRSLRFYEANNSPGNFPAGANYVALKAPSSMSSDVTLTLPGSDGSAGQVLSTNGSGVMSWINANGASTPVGGDLSGTIGSATVSKINGANLGTTTPSNGYVLVANGTQWNSVNLTGDADISAGGNVSLSPSGVAAGSYGDATHATTLTIDAKGRVTSASQSQISGVSPGGSAGGDLSGSYPNPSIANGSVTSSKIANGAISNIDVNANANIAYSKLDLNNSIETTDLVNGSVTDQKIASSAVNTSKLANAAVTDAKVANGISYSKLSGAPSSLPPSGAAGGDLTSNYPNPLIASSAITTSKIANGAVTDAKVANGISYSKLSGAPSSLPPTGSAGGDLSGSYPNPQVAKINGATLGSTTPSAGNMLVGSGSQWSSVNMSGDAQLGSAGVLTVNNNAITDAKVVDALTINGGSISNSPISGSTGDFTTLHAGSSAFAVDASGNLIKVKNVSYDFPSAQGANGSVLMNNGVGGLSWSAAALGSVTADATLSGDGSSTTPLGVNLGHVNSWIATQYLPVTAAQGGALINSINAASTTIDAQRIANGLSDSQVNDDLTINGGSVNASPIGVTTPASGAFTTLDAGSSKLQIDAVGNITKINNVSTSFPAAQGAANTVLTNDGAGNLSWAASAGGSGSSWNEGGNSAPSSTLLGNNATNGNLDLRAGNATRMSINGTKGFVGVNKATPEHQLDVYRNLDPAGSGFLSSHYGLLVKEDVHPSTTDYWDINAARFDLNFANSNQSSLYSSIATTAHLATQSGFTGSLGFAAGLSGSVYHTSGTINEAHGGQLSVSLDNGATINTASSSAATITNYGGTITNADVFSTAVGNYGFNANANIPVLRLMHLYAPDNYDLTGYGWYAASISSLCGLRIDDFSGVTPAPTTVQAINYADKFIVGVDGNLSKIRNVGYTFPAANGGGVLTNDGAGNLSWASASGSSATVYPTNSPSQLTANTNDWSIAANATHFRVSSNAAINLTGINSTGSSDGRIIVLSNVGSSTITLSNEDSGSSAENRFTLASSFTLDALASATLIYDSTSQRWRVIARN